ncbi:MAG: DUF5309 domain-containing protein [Tannerella sp.]|jgi:hypothetical protein|nr:DUF5309 domain-containing protein [Tannerella sp.]
MKSGLLKLRESGLLMVITLLLCSLFGIVDAGAMTADVVATTGAGVAEHNNGGETVAFAQENVDDFIQNSLDKELLKLEPYRFSMDTIARQIPRTKRINSQIREYYTQGFLPTETRVKTAVTSAAQAAIDFTDNGNIAINETLIVQGVSGYLPGSSTVDPLRDLVLVVVERDSSGKPICKAVNGIGNDPASGSGGSIPALSVNTTVARSMRAASETQIRTDVFKNLPTKKYQYLQKAIAEVEESTFFQMAEKEIHFTFDDITERALLEYRREVNNGYWKGTLAKLKMANKYNDRVEDTYFTEGIWYQAGDDFTFSGNPITANRLIDLCVAAFAGPSSSDQKVLMCSTNFLTELQKVQYNSVIYPGERHQLFGFNLSSIISNFGELLIFHAKDMNEVGLRGNAFILDHNYLEKVTMGWRTIPIDNVKTGQRDSRSRILTEPSALILKNNEAHLRVSLT